MRGFKSIVNKRCYFIHGLVEGLLASEVILGLELCGDVWEISWLRGQEHPGLFAGVSFEKS